MLSHAKFLTQALTLAKIRKGFCSPNPAVGAVIINGMGEVIAEGFHQGPGTPHAEIDALKKIKQIPSDATMYVTLEPCCHFGRTPPCTDAIIASGIKKVFYAFKDPNPIVAGKGEEKLRANGIHCQQITNTAINNFYQSYAYWHKKKLPFVTAKIAMSLDNIIASKDSKPIKITGDAINHFTHQERKTSDAILTTITTVINDDPALNARIITCHPERSSEGPQTHTIPETAVYKKPLYILDRELRLPLTAKLFSTTQSITVFHSKEVSKEKIARLSESNIRLIPIKENNDKLDLIEILIKIGEDGIHDLWIEAGGKCFTAFLNQKLLNKAYIYIAPKILGEGRQAFEYNKLSHHNINFTKIGDDMLCALNFMEEQQ